MKTPPDILHAAYLLDGLKGSIHATCWSYYAQLERLKLFKKGHAQDVDSWFDCAQSNPTDQNLRRLAENGSREVGYLELLLTELEVFSDKCQSFVQFVDDVELQLGTPRTGGRV